MAGSMDESAAAIEALRSETGHLQLHSMSPSEKVHIAVEVCLKSSCTARSYDLRMAAERMLKKKTLTYKHGPISLSESDDPFLLNNVESITICDADGSDTDTEVLLFWQVELNVYVYQLNDDPPVSEETDGNGNLASFQEWFLPAKEFQGLWESLVCDTGLKHRLLKYATTALQFAERKVDPNIVSWNRVVLLHGPPGTGKTSLCKALAQKLAIYSSDRYAQAQFLEVNAHSLFSKWFSESGKLVTKLFEKIHELIQDGDVLVFILIDEVESLVAARQAALSGSEPSDSIRVVNSLLTQLDKLKSSSNVFVLTTSNITGAIDIAFLDRADIKAYIGPPSVQARYKILKSCLAELFRTGIIGPANPELLCFRAVKESVSTSNGHLANSSLKISSYLLSAAEACEGLSGRTLRKLPFLAHASTNGQTDCLSFLEALHLVIKQELADRASMTTCKSSLGGFAQ